MPIVSFIILNLFLWTGITSACYNSLGNPPTLMQYSANKLKLKYWQIKLLNKSILSSMGFVGIPLPWQVLQTCFL